MSKLTTALNVLNSYMSYRTRYELVFHARDNGFIVMVRNRHNADSLIDFAEGYTMDDAIIKLVAKLYPDV